MRRLAALWCLCAMLLGEVAQAKSQLIIGKVTVTGQGNDTGKQAVIAQQKRNARLIASCIAATGGSVTTIRCDATKTEWVRAGYMVWNIGNTTPLAPSSGAYKEQFDATICTDQVEATVGFLRVDSLFRSPVQGGATHTDTAKPLLYLRTNEAMMSATGNPFTATTDTVYGASDTDNGPGKAIHAAGDQIAFLTHAYTEGGLGVGNESAVRRILFGNIPQADYRVSNGTNSGATLGCRNCDSLITYAATDTCILWDRQFSTLFGQASTAVVASAWGAGAASDSIGSFSNGDPYDPPTEGDLTILMCALAHLDSLSGHKVFGNKIIRIAPVVYGALARGPRHSWNWNKTQGINPADTSSFYAILDSLTAHPEIKVTFAANVDSASEYARDIIKLKSVPQARFTPQVWDGVDDTTASAVRFPQDIFGRYHKRAAVGDSMNHALCSGGSDNSIAWSMKRARNMCDSIFAGRTSRIAVAPADDWSPRQITGADAGGTGIDSVLYALNQAGYIGVIADAQDPDANASKTNAGPSKTNPRGYYNTQMRYVNRLPGTTAASGGITSFTAGGGINMKILCHSGFNLQGGRSQAESYTGTVIDSSSAPPLAVFTIYKELGRLWASALLDYDESYDLFPYDNTSGVGDPRAGSDILYRKLDYSQAKIRRPVLHGNIVRLSCADLSGASGTSIVPAATMWHVLKAAANAMYYINKLAGRTVVMFDYPDNIVP